MTASECRQWSSLANVMHVGGSGTFGYCQENSLTTREGMVRRSVQQSFSMQRRLPSAAAQCCSGTGRRDSSASVLRDAALSRVRHSLDLCKLLINSAIVIRTSVRIKPPMHLAMSSCRGYLSSRQEVHGHYDCDFVVVHSRYSLRLSFICLRFSAWHYVFWHLCLNSEQQTLRNDLLHDGLP